ncbi:MAG: serine--tRNA ligase [Candidatus Lambdaproteobacteria bacterium RIFOXYD1_FULL_56_27]|uniref:Serine--tRNA ligase n=1 Tax=Candidatus Lambdaproteobacteria bacterium RIFOXYD2_FULL_56_26 TaxID=1817773 RepID=A0A1F6GP18_9PROT|nr:MAG: serine--tRNA ligase [Candidatus Lambdaproteobacteria bacterium RIFOXYD2_FULL_56_26]OGH03877.1 MAG: serine--tRNA ligase [Candidatus Lambdaproteobacteria bacterium RIFOXYC1_FULL_56_13]OGH08923.1 MAG: serine--tRNA ligase [Candidatus Lambdaproteobacteria bacterium RIFOXYD1_FULL_56_27]
MIDLKILREEPQVVADSCAKRGFQLDLGQLAQLDRERRTLSTRNDELKAKRNESSQLVGKGKLEPEQKQKLIEETRTLGETIKGLDQSLKEVEEKVTQAALGIPNLIHSSTPVGKSELDNQEVRTWGQIPQFTFAPKHHADLGEALGILDAARGVKIAQSRFTLVRGLGARLERALAAFMLDLHTGQHGYQEVNPPLLVNAESLTGTGQLPKFEEDLFKTTGGLYLIPTAEVPVTNIYRDEVLPEEALPLYFCAHTPCFRSEAGSYGRDTKGYIRQHQFNKVELVKFAHPDHSFEELEKLVNNAERVLQLLNLPHRVVALCSGDIGFSAAKCYDLEVWLPSEGRYREISSCSNCTDFQARRAQIRFKPKDGGKPRLVHTLNGSGLAVGRTLVAILENYQREDGSVEIPEALRPYMGGLSELL